MPWKSDEACAILYARVPRDIHKDFRILSAINHRSVNDEVNLALAEYLRERRKITKEAAEKVAIS
jgi:hypothetical protein